ncbi:hypothetical protein B296_00042964, partial [Ensete ventricosum]
LDDAVGSRRKFARRFAKGIGKLAWNAKGDRRKEDWRTYRKIAGGCRSIRKFGWRLAVDGRELQSDVGQSQVQGIEPGLGRCSRELARVRQELVEGSEACREFVKSWPRVSRACQEFFRSLSKEIGSLLGQH